MRGTYKLCCTVSVSTRCRPATVRPTKLSFMSPALLCMDDTPRLTWSMCRDSSFDLASRSESLWCNMSFSARSCWFSCAQ